MLRYYRFLAQHTVTLRTFMLGVFFNLMLAGSKETSPELLLVGYSVACITIIFGRIYLRGYKPFYLICSSL